mmetsp:Transcript_77508/g.146232  ORF Transcript_77508/g.146232 Transcript_77508/m.146232 type:complete len:296 (-) Transcript_77508:149-1036(-)
MQRLGLLLALFACLGHGRRVQTSGTLMADDDLAKLQKKMADKKFKHIQELEAQIDKDMATLVADPSLMAFNEEADRIIAVKMKEIFAEPEFKNIHEYSEAIDALIEELNTNVKVVNEQMESMSTETMTVEEQMKVMEEKPEFQAFQARRTEIDEKIKAMKALPNFEKFQEHAKEVIDKEVEALKQDPKFKTAQDKAQQIDEKMAKMTADPNFKEYQELVIKVADLTKDEPEAQSLAQISESRGKVERKRALSPENILSELLSSVSLTAAFDVASSHSRTWKPQNNHHAWMKWKHL